MQHPRSFTTVEMIIVVVLMGLILLTTILMGWGYLQTIQFRQEKELLIGTFDETLTIARTSTYYESRRYDNLDMLMSATGYQIMVSTGTNSPVGDGTLVNTYHLQWSHLTFNDDPLHLRMEPYQLNCEVWQGGTGFQLVSDISDQTTCFEITTDVCKITQVPCN